ncbi:hypothetical protein J2T41_002614 [Pseudomonas citronellolis]|uniref:hypothetical protein n=1 Tax=Pseudomonas citronellolis TaxID=53408 RepID=UPI0020A22FFD|nr:hypothetical protein [Pseudomonas citronellolis]MCP1642995.1 hypothetical protein [Pseudomonas citronellolis]MCP1665873.1 hypothetical protein [Pseudomonas citronellolis]MCP1696782.1 hypothetical protein [Pseudomonas citronellolis]MCP1703476.1 hypothetical protein [Pseudomonas citronellolis]MCP1797610.1 hypothetical protein [Pseudomonas citronellolis]
MRVSEYFKLNRSQAYLDFVDVPLDTDLAVFLEPGAIKALQSSWGNELSSLLQSFFETVLNLIRAGNHTRAQALLSSLNERNEFHLGYSTGKSRGHGFGSGSAKSVWSELTKSQAAVTGLLRDLEDTALLIPGIGADMISDAVCNIIRGPLIKYTQDMCVYYGIPLTDGIPSGPMWNPQTERWEQEFVPLPMTDFGKVIFVPKVLVRFRLSYSFNEYYSHYILPQMQQEHLDARSPLVEVLKNGEMRVTKKALIEKYGKDKLAAVEQTKIRPDILQGYRRDKASTISLPIPLDDFAEVEASPAPDLDALLAELRGIQPGRDGANDYENVIEKILSVIFYPSLCNPRKQDEIHNGRKRIDITYSNEAKRGFFYWMSLHYSCAHIFVECKNYGKEVGNPEIDQLAGRFSPGRGQVGILVCRSIEDKELLRARCVDTAKDGRGFMIALDDQDLIELVNGYNLSGDSQEFPLLRELWRHLIN